MRKSHFLAKKLHFSSRGPKQYPFSIGYRAIGEPGRGKSFSGPGIGKSDFFAYFVENLHFSHFGEKWPGGYNSRSARHSHSEPRESRDAFMHF